MSANPPRRRRRLLALSLLALGAAGAGPAAAQVFSQRPLSFDVAPGQGPSGYVDGFFVLDNRLVYDVDGGPANSGRVRFGQTDDLRGGGVEARLDVVPGVFLTGEYRRGSFNRIEALNFATGAGGGAPIDTDLTTIRGGAGLGAAVGGVPVYVRGEYSSLKLDGIVDRQSGFGVLAGFAAPLNRVVGVEAEAGYQDNRDFGRGFEYRLGGWLNVIPNLALTLHYRRTRLEHGEIPGDGYLETGGAGVRFQFGGAGLPAP